MTCPICDQPNHSLSPAAMQFAQQTAAIDNQAFGNNYRDWWREGRQKYIAWQGRPPACICQPTQPTQVQAARQLQAEGRAFRIGPEKFHPSVQARIDREQAEKLAQHRRNAAKQQVDQAAREMEYARKLAKADDDALNAIEAEHQAEIKQMKDDNKKLRDELKKQDDELKERVAREDARDFAAGRTKEQRRAEAYCDEMENATTERAASRLARKYRLSSNVNKEDEFSEVSRTRFESGTRRWMERFNDDKKQFLQNAVERQRKDEELKRVLSETDQRLGMNPRSEAEMEANREHVRQLEVQIRENERAYNKIIAERLKVSGYHMENFFACAEDIEGAGRKRVTEVAIKIAAGMVVTRGVLPLPVIQTEILGNSLLSVKEAIAGPRCQALLQQLGVNQEQASAPEDLEADFAL